MCGQLEIARRAFAQRQTALLQEGHQRGHPGGKDLFAGPAGGGSTHGCRCVPASPDPSPARSRRRFGLAFGTACYDISARAGRQSRRRKPL